jgi:hypothetical protein
MTFSCAPLVEDGYMNQSAPMTDTDFAILFPLSLRDKTLSTRDGNTLRDRNGQ